MDTYPLIRKGLAVGIILLSIGTSVLSSTAQKIEKPSLLTSREAWLYVGGSGPGNYTRIQNVIDNVNDNNTVTITLKSGQFDQKTGTIRGILGYTVYIENRGPKEIWYHSSSILRTLFSHQTSYLNISGNVPPQWGAFDGRIPIISFHPILTMTVRVTVTNTSTNLTLERSSIELFTSFFIWLTGPESVTGPS